MAISRLAMILLIGLAATAQLRGEDMNYGQVREFLAEHTQVVELSDGQDARVAVCPEWQGRVMTSTCGGTDGPSFGFVNRPFVEAGEHDVRFNCYGAEDRLWISPEGGQFSLWFKPGAEQNLDNWYTPPALNEGTWQVVASDDSSCKMNVRVQFQNTSATDFDIEITREVRLLGQDDLEDAFGPQAAALLAGDDVSRVAYESVNTITNRGPAMTKESGLVSMWILGMLNASPGTVVVMPYKQGSEAELGPVVKSDYFGDIPADRLKITPEAILFKADAKYRSKIGTSQKRAVDVAGAIDFAEQTMTLIQFSVPDDATQHDYMNNMWEVPLENPYEGDVANSYNDGPPAPGEKGLGEFYELESLSPAVALKTGESLTHRHRTIHLTAGRPTGMALAKQVLHVDGRDVRDAMLGD